MIRFFRPGLIASLMYPGAIFRIKTTEKLLYLTFDDGPDKCSTSLLLEILDKYKIKAIFFCNGVKAAEFPDLVRNIRDKGHIIGNHGWNHEDGWKTPLKRYISNIKRADGLTSPELFRPPYGHLGICQFRKLTQKYKIVFWDILPYDFDRKFQKEKSLEVLKRRIRPGSVIVLHDSAFSSSPVILEEFLQYALGKGFRFDNKL